MDFFHISSLKHHISPLSTTTALSLKHPSAFCNGEHLFAVTVLCTFNTPFSTTSARSDAYTTHDVVSGPKVPIGSSLKKKFICKFTSFSIFSIMITVSKVLLTLISKKECETNRMH